VWDNPISASIRSPLCYRPSTLVGNSLYWFLIGYHQGSGIVEFDLDRNSLAEIDAPVRAHARHSQILRMEDSSLGLAILSDLCTQLWEKANINIDAGWMLQKTIELDKRLPLRPLSCLSGSRTNKPWMMIRGYDEDSNVIFVSAQYEVYMIQL
jgi:hypothetical protein